MHHSIDSKDSQGRQKPAKDAKEKDFFSQTLDGGT